MYTIRYAIPEDAPVLGDIHSASWKAAYNGIVPDEVLTNITPEKRTRYFQKALNENREHDAIIFDDGKPCGFICIGSCRDKDMDSSYGEVWGIYLRPDYYHKGAGSVLMQWGIDELLKNHPYKYITLWVLKDNINARNFYENFGFHFDGTVNTIKLGKNLDEIRYIKTIKGRN